MDAGVDSLDRLLRTAADIWPDRPAVESPSGSFTYAELDGAVTAAAGGLLSAGLEPGDRVALALAHDAPLFVAPFVCSRIGVTGFLLNASLAPDQWARQLARVRPTLCVADGAHIERLRSVATGRVATASRAFPLDGDTRQTGLPAVPADPDRAVAQIATSGTTGEPTIVGLTSRGLLHVGRAYLALLPLGEDERSLVVMPLTYIGALSTQTMTMPLVGGCNVLPADRRPVGARARMAEQRITLLDAVPSWLTVLTREPRGEVPTWRTLVYGGEPMPPATAHALASRFPHVAMYDVWGLTEAHGPVAALRYDPARPSPPGTVGRPLTGLRVRAAGPAGPLPPGVHGELEVSGPTVVTGAPQGPPSGARAGWLPTGDLGTVDADGTVTVTDRRKDLILRGGMNVSAREVEQVLAGGPDVADVAVFAVADELGGEAVGAAVVTGSGAPPAVLALRRLVAERVGVHAVPRRLLHLDELPRNATGKVDKRALRSLDG